MVGKWRQENETLWANGYWELSATIVFLGCRQTSFASLITDPSYLPTSIFLPYRLRQEIRSARTRFQATSLNVWTEHTLYVWFVCLFGTCEKQQLFRMSVEVDGIR